MSEETLQNLTENLPTPTVSVVLPVYNGAQYLAEAISSILAQTFENFELIMIDDGSTDMSPQILTEYARHDSRIRVIVRENRGLATTLNESIDVARGKWIARMDQDDIALPHRFERQLQWLERTGSDLCGSWVQRFGSSDKRILRLRQTDEAVRMEMLFASPFAHPAVMMRTASAKLLRYDKAYEKAEDYDLWTRAAQAGWKMTNVPEVLLLYRIHSAQISTLTAARQQQLGQEIRRRYWGFVFHSMQLNSKWNSEALKIFDLSLPAIEMDAVDASFTELMQHNFGESRSVIFYHATRLYFKVAANCPNIVSRWSKLNQEFGVGLGITTKFKLWMFCKLRIQVSGDVFKRLKYIYIYMGGA